MSYTHETVRRYAAARDAGDHRTISTTSAAVLLRVLFNEPGAADEAAELVRAADEHPLPVGGLTATQAHIAALEDRLRTLQERSLAASEAGEWDLCHWWQAAVKATRTEIATAIKSATA